MASDVGVIAGTTSVYPTAAGMDDAAEHLSSISDAGGISFTQEGERRYSRGVSEMGNEFSEISPVF